MNCDELARADCRQLSREASGRLDGGNIAELLTGLPGWRLDGDAIVKDFAFADYAGTMAFVNGVAWMAQRQDHHPELTVGYNRCRVAYVTHSVGGISLKDFICAAKVEALSGI